MSDERQRYEDQYAEVYQNPEGWRFRIRAANHEIIASGEAYENFHGVMEGLNRVHPGIRVSKVDPLEGQQGIP